MIPNERILGKFSHPECERGPAHRRSALVMKTEGGSIWGVGGAVVDA
jgi:hypothetical protein